MPSQEILKIRDGTPLEAEEILTYIKTPRNGSVWHFSGNLYVPSNVVQKKRVARILFFKIRPSQEILKIRDGTPLEAEEILTYIKNPRNGSVWHFSTKPSQEIVEIRDDTHLEAEEILTYIKNPRNGSVWHFYRKLYVPSNVVQKKTVARILFFKIRPSQEILKIRDGTPLEAEEILTYIKNPRNGSVWHFYGNLYVPSNVVQKKRVARILFFKIRPSQEILKIRDGTPLEAEKILTYIKNSRNGSVWHFSGNLYVPSNVVQKKRVARILFFKIRPSQYILEIRDGTPLEKRVARILFFKIRPSQEILKIRDGTPMEAEAILTYIKNPRNGSVWHFSGNLYVPSNVVQKKRVARILFFKIRPSQEILKIRDGTPLEAGEILTYIKNPRNGSVWHFSGNLYVPSNVVQKKRVARILFFKIRPSQEILKIHDGTPLEVEEILTYIKKPSKRIGLAISRILKIRDGPLEAEEILAYIKNPRNGSVWHFSGNLYVPSNVVQKKRVARILFFKIRPSQEILRIRDGTPLEAEEILTYIKNLRNGSVWPSQDILKIRDGTPLEAEEILTYIKNPRNGSVWHFYSKLYVPSNVVQKKRVARILFFKIRPSQEILKIRDGTPLEAEEILTYIKNPRNESVWHFFGNLYVPSNVVQKKRVARILFFKIRPSQEILKIRDGTPLEAEEILTYIKNPRNGSVWHFSTKPSQDILEIRDDTHLEAEEILTYIKNPRNGSVWHFYRKLYVPSNVLQKKRVARILFFKIRPSQEILKIRDGTPLEAEEILTYIKNPRNGSVWHFYGNLYVPSNVVQKKRVARILFFKIRPSQEILKIRDGTPLEKRVAWILFFKIRPSQDILKIRDGTPLEAEEILTYIKNPRNGSVWHFSGNLYVPSNVVQKKRVARILFFKIRPSQEILKIRDGTPLEAEEILTYIKNSRNGSVWHFSGNLFVPSNVVQKKRVARILFFKIRPSQYILEIRDGTPLEKTVARILFFKIRPSQEILKIRDGTPLEAEEILTYIKNPRNGSVWHFYGNLYVPSNVVQKKRVARILFFKIRPSQEILKIRDGTPLEAEEILTYIKNSRNGSVWHFSGNLFVPSNVVQKKRVARILFFKIRPSQYILEIRDGTPLEKRVARILFFKIRPSQKILKIRDGTPMEAEAILTYIKNPRNGSVWHFSGNLYVPSNVVQKKRVARILFFKIRPSQEILKIRDGTPLEAEEILTYIKNSRNGSVWHFSGNLFVPSNVVQKKRVARILFFKIRPSQYILEIRDGTPLEAEEILTYIKNPRNGYAEAILTYIKNPRNGSVWPSQDILKIRDGTPLEAEEILTYIKNPRNGSVWHFYSKLYVPSNVVQKKRVARILFFKIRPSQEILRIRDGTPLEAEEILTYIKNLRNGSKRVARILFFKIRPSQEILKIRDGTPLEAEEILTYIKTPRNGSVWHFSGNLYVPSNVVQKKRVARILFFKIRPSQEILKIRDGTPLEAEEILTYIKNPRNGSVWHFSTKLYVPSNKKRVAWILFFKIRPSQEIVEIRDDTHLEAEEILTYIKNPRNGSVWHFYRKLYVPSNVVQKKTVARILFFKIRPSQEILKIRDGTPLEAEEILTYIKNPRNGSVWHFYGNLYVPSNVVQKKRVARILFFKIRPSQEILKIRDGTPLEAEEILTYIKNSRNGSVWHFSGNLFVPSNVVQKKRVARILFFKIRPSQYILEIRDGTPLEAEEILTYIKNPRNGYKRVARILFFKIRPSQKILKIRDGTPMEAEAILTYIKNPRNGSVWHFSGNLYVPSNVVQKKRVARILFFKIRPSQEILKIRDGTPLEAEEILTYIKNPRNGSVWHFSGNLYVPSNVVQKKRVARILFFKIRPSQEILKIRDGTPLEVEEILTYIKKPSKRIDNVVQKKRVAWILFFKIRPSQDILKIRDGTPLEAEEILTYIKNPRNGSVWHFYSKLYVPSNVVQKKRVARILFFKIRPSQEILRIRDGTPLEAEEILAYIKNPRNGSVWHFSGNLYVPSNVVQKKKVAWILFFKIRPSQEILKIRDGYPLEAEDILIYIKKPSNKLVWHFSSNLDVPTNVLQKKRVARILFFKIRPSQEILKIRDGTPMEKKRVARILFFKIRPSQEILKIRDGTPMEAEEILIYIKRPSNKSVWHFSSNLDVPTNVVQKKRVVHILFFKIRSSQEILKIRDGTPMEAEEILTYIKKPSKQNVQKKRVARILFFKIRPSQEILKIRDGTPLEAEEILIYIKKPSKKSVWHFSSNLDVPTNVVQKKRVARILFFKIRPSQEILKIRDGTPMEAEEILIYIKRPSNKSVWHFSSNLDVPTNVVQKKRVVHILFFKIRSSQEILKIRDGTPMEAEEILTYIKKPSKQIVQKKRVAWILFFKIRPSQDILEIRDDTHLEAEEILTYIKNPRNGSVWHFYRKLYVPSNVVQKKTVARILFFKIRPSQEILKIRDGTPLETEEILTYIKNPRNGSVWHFYGNLYVPSNVVQKKRVARILFFKIRPSQEILKIRDGTPLEVEEILTYIKNPRNGSVGHFSGNLYVPSNVVQKKRVARILFFKIRPSQEILKIHDSTPLEVEEILTYIKKPSKRIVARILFFKIRPSQEILKIRDGPLEAEEILAYIKNPRNGSVWHFSGNLYVPSNVVQKKKVAWILFFKIRPSQEILKIRDGYPLEAEDILIYIKKPSNKSVWHFSSNLDVPTNVLQKKEWRGFCFSKLGHLKKF
ncbi:hypothetical protein OROHE_015171 [Orobanche hederae]